MKTDDELWDDWHNNHDRPSRDALIVRYQPLVDAVAQQVIRRSYRQDWGKLDDAKANGQFGLIDAIERYDPNMGAKFETYAQRRIKGAIHDASRQQGVLPRSFFDEARRFLQAEERLVNELGRFPSLDEVAAELGVTLDEADRLRGSAEQTTPTRSPRVGVGAPASEQVDHTSLGHTGDDLIETAEFRAAVADAVRRIDGPARIVFGLYYFKGMRMLDIGKLMGISAGTVSKLHTQAVVEVKRLLEGLDQDSSDSSS